MDICDILVGTEDENKLPNRLENVRFVFFLADNPSHQKVNPEGTQLSPHLECQFEALCEEIKDIFPQHQGDIGLSKLIIIDIKMDHPPLAQKPYTLPIKHNQWEIEELEMLEKIWDHHPQCLTMVNLQSDRT